MKQAVNNIFDLMLFGRPTARENIPLFELQPYLNSCFDAKLKRLSQQMPIVESNLADSLSLFKNAIITFSNSDQAPDMEYLFRIKEASVKSDKANYSNSLLHLFSTPLEYNGDCLYMKGKNMLSVYSAFITDVMRINNNFKLVIIGYAAGLAEAKKPFINMERLCKELKKELDLCILEDEEYRKIQSKIRAMHQLVSELKTPDPTSSYTISAVDNNARMELEKQLAEAAKALELAKHDYHKADSLLAHLLLPLERVARKHDHTSSSKRKLTEYVKDPIGLIITKEDATVISQHLSAVEKEISDGTIDAKNASGVVSQIALIRSNDILALAITSRAAALHVKSQESKLLDRGF